MPAATSTGAEAAEVERHLGECSGCQVLWSGVRESLAVLQAAHAELPAAAALHRRAIPRDGGIGAEGAALAKARLDFRGRRGGGVAAAAGVVAGARVVPEAPRMLARIPAGAGGGEGAPASGAGSGPTWRTAPRRAPLTVKLQTADPKIVIYWIAD